jgi:thiol-disulfide isomerase/thioredoxin
METSNYAVLALLLGLTFILSGCSMLDVQNKTAGDEKSFTWRNIELKDISTGKAFAINDFNGRPVLLESFAIWCQLCSRQQHETKKLRQQAGDSIIYISIDTDPNEDEDAIKSYIAKNGFDWRYAIASKEMTQSLIGDFGIKVVNAPGVPMILVCEDQSARLLESGLKPASRLKEEVAQGC